MQNHSLTKRSLKRISVTRPKFTFTPHGIGHNDASSFVRVILFCFILLLCSRSDASVTNAVVSRNAPHLNHGRIKGSVHVLTGGNFNLNSGLTVEGSLMVPGNPQFKFTGGFTPPPLQRAGGSPQPSNYRITINGGVSLGGIILEADPVPFPSATVPTAGNGNRTVIIDDPNQSPGDYTTIRTLVINAQGGSIDLPPGRYDRITLNGSSSINLKGGTAAHPSLYEIQRIDVNGGSHVNVGGYAVLRIKNSLNLNGYMGNPAHPEWLDLSVSNGSLTLNSQSAFHGRAVVPSGTLTVNGNSLLHGQAFTDKLVLNGNGIIECEASGGTPNLPPVAQSSEISTWIGEPVAISLQASDPENQALSYQIVSQPLHGSLSVSGNTAVYTPDISFAGDDTFHFRASDGDLESESATVTIHVFRPNRPPIATNQVVVLNQGEVNAPITLDAMDPDGDAISFQITSQPALGTLGGSAPLITYTHSGPRATAPIEDTLTFTAIDSNGAVSQSGTITIQLQPVNRAPIAISQFIQVNEDESASILLAATDEDGDVIEFTYALPPGFPGRIEGSGSNLVFAPEAEFHGTTAFSFTVTDPSGASSSAQIGISVLPLNDAPIAFGSAHATDQGTMLPIMLHATDVDDDVLSYELTTFPLHGSISGTAPEIYYTPEAGFHGEDSFTFIAKDADQSSVPATIILTVRAVNHVPIAATFSVTTAEDTAVPIVISATDADGDAVSYSITRPPSQGTLSGTAPGFIYTPNPDWNGTDSFSYTASDSSSTSLPAMVSILVTPVNDPPRAPTVTYTLDEDSSFQFRLNTTDVDGQTLTYSVFPGARGNLLHQHPLYTYFPHPNYHGTDSLFYFVSDSISSVFGRVNFTIRPVNDAPVAVAQSVNVSSSSSAAITLTGNDIDGDAITFEITSQPQHGRLTGNPPDLVYSPAPNHTGPDSFAFVASDGILHSQVAAVDITVTPAGTVPIAESATYLVRQRENLEFTLSGTSAEGDTLTYQITRLPESGGFISGSGQKFVYTPDIDFTGKETIEFTATSTRTFLSSEPAVVTFEVTPNNLPPVAENIAVTIDSAPVDIVLPAFDPENLPLYYFIDDSASNHVEITGEAPYLTLRRLTSGARTVSFYYYVEDDMGLYTAADVTVKLLGPNSNPNISSSLFLFAEDTTNAFRVMASDPDLDPLAYSISLPPGSPLIIEGSGPDYLARLSPDFNGWTTATVTVTDGRGGSATSQLGFTVTPKNDAPFFYPGAHVTAEDTPLELATPATDPEGSPLSYKIVSHPLHGSLDGTLPFARYTPDPNFNGIDSMVISVSDGSLTTTSTIGIEVVPVNDPPVAQIATGRAVGLSTPISLSGSDVDGDPLIYYLVVQPNLGSVSIDGGLFTYTTDQPFFGTLRLSYVAYDGFSSSLPAPIVITGGVAPEARILSPMAGARLPMGEVLTVKTEASDADGSIVRYELLANGAVAATSSNGEISWTPGQSGPIELSVRVLDDSAISFTSAPLLLNVIGENQAPTAFAGSDLNVFAVNLGPNLIQNGGCELPLDSNGDVPFWDRMHGMQDLTKDDMESFNPTSGGNYRYFPAAPEGLSYFGPVDAESISVVRTSAALSQTIDLGSDSADSGSAYLFKAKIHAHTHDGSTGSNPNLRQPRIELQFLSEDGLVLHARHIRERVSNNMWHPMMLRLVRPTGAVSLKVSLIDDRGPGFSTFHYSLFDDIGLYEFQAPSPLPSETAISLTGDVSDDGLPTFGQLRSSWIQISGPPAILADPNWATTPVSFTAIGQHVFKFTASDGEKTGSDTLAVNVGSTLGENAPPIISLASEMQVTVGTASHPLDAGVRDDGKPSLSIHHYWEQISGPSNASFADTRSASTTFTVAVPGNYVFRFTSHDGDLASDSDIVVTATCEPVRQPIDLMIVTDHSGSMFGPEPGVIMDWEPVTPIYQARRLTAAILQALDPSLDRVSIVKNDQSSSGGGTMAFTSDMNFAAEKIIMPQGESLIEGYDSMTLPAISRIVNFVHTNGRPEARKIILHLNDGVAGVRDDFPTPAQIAGYGITTMSVSMTNMKNDPINRLEISGFVSTPSHAFFVDSLSDPAVLQDILKAAMSPLCRGVNNPPSVRAGDAAYLPTVASIFQPNALVTDDQDTEMLSLTWEQVSGPAPAQISNFRTLRPSIQFTETGSYIFRLSAMDGGSTASDTVMVMVGADSSTPTPAGLVAYWPFDGSMRDIIGNRTLVPQYPQMAMQFVTDAKAGQALDLTGRTFPFHQTDGEFFSLHGATNGMAVSFWCKAPAAGNTGTILQFAGYSPSSNGDLYNPIPSLGITYESVANRFNFNYGLENGNSTTVSSNPSIGAPDLDQWNHVLINYDDVLKKVSIFVNATLSSTFFYTTTHPPVFARNGQSLTIGPSPYVSGIIDRSAAPSTPVFNGMMDELAIFNRSLGIGDIANLVNRTAGLTPPSLNPPPVVNAGLDQLASLTNPIIQLNGFVTDDNVSPFIAWTLQSGPAEGAEITNPGQANTIVTFSQAGSYTFELRADDGFQTVTDTVEIRVDQPCVSPVPQSAFIWLKGEGDSRDAIGANDLKWHNQPAYTAGKTGKAFEFTGTNGILESGVLEMGNPNELTLEGWFRDNSSGEGSQNLFEILTQGTISDPYSIVARTRVSIGGIRYLEFHASFLGSNGTPQPNTFVSLSHLNTDSHPVGEFFHLAVSASRQHGVSFYVNGALIANRVVPSTLTGLHIPKDPVLRLGGRNNLQIYPRLTADEFTAYHRVLDVSELLAIYQANTAGKCPSWAQPQASSGYADAGVSAILQEPGIHLFYGSFEADDFAPNPTVSWSQVNGPAAASLSGSDTLTPSALISIPGRYLFKLDVTDGMASGSDTVIVDLQQAPNTPPVLTWTPPSSLVYPQDTLVFAPSVSDDGLPSGRVTSGWRVVAGPAQVIFTGRAETADPHDVIARFPATGIYQIELIVSDGLLTTTNTFSVTVHPESTPPPNTAPLFSLGVDFTASDRTVLFFPTVFDDGLPSGQIIARWDFDSGPGIPRFDLPANASSPEASVTFPLPGTYEIRLNISDGVLSSSDTVIVVVPQSLFHGSPQTQSAPVLAEIAPLVLSLPATELFLQPSFTDEDGPSADYVFDWEQVTGPETLAFSDLSGATTTITFPELGTYVVKFTLTDGPFIRSRYITLHYLPAPNLAPSLSISPPGGTAAPMSTVTLAANATDDGNPGPLTYEWDWLASPAAGEPIFSASSSAVTDVTFPAPGDYVLYCRVNDGELSRHQAITYRVLGEPSLAILTPEDGGTVSDRRVTEAQIRAFRDGGSVNSVVLALDGVSLGQARLEPDSFDYFLNLPAMIHGSHTLTATATYDDGTVVIKSSQFQLADHAEESLVLEIESPHENTADVTAPTAVVGTIKSTHLKNYRLEIAPVDAPLAKKTIATGTAAVVSGSIGILDPTLLENGLYTLTLSGTTTTGLYAATSEKIVIDGAMKLGQFSLAFEDMSINLPGTPLSVTRTYDSRDPKGGDFGPGWSLATSSVKIRKTRPLNLNWEQNLQDSGFVTNWIFQVQPTHRKRIIVSFPGGRSEIFETAIRAAVPVSSELTNSQRYSAIYSARYHFTPVGDTEGRLEVEGESEIFWAGVSNDFINTPSIPGQFTGANDAASDPTRFRYIEPGGAVYIIDETQGLLAIRDSNGNALTINRSGVHHSAGESLLFQRNQAGLITSISDNLGRTTSYTYDGMGRLIFFTNRLGHTNHFEYNIPAFPHHITGIRDGNNILAVRTDYDADGRMVSQTDASGKSIHFGHDVASRRESISDRLGNQTVHEFDEFGNITRSTDALGGVTLRSYDANDNEISTTTPLGFTTTRSFDVKGNLLQEIDPLGNTSSYSYDPEKRPLTISDALNHGTSMAYGINGNLTSMTDPAGASTRFGYTGDGNISTLTDANGTVTSYTHDSKGRETTMKVTAANGTVLSSEAYDYDAAGNRVRTITTDGQRFFTSTYTYDAENRLTQTISPDGISATTYDANGKVLTEKNTIGETTTHTYDSRGNLIQTTHPGTNRITRSGYDVEGRMTSSTDMSGATTYTLYDALGRKTATILPDATMPPTILTEVAAIASAPALADNPRSTTTYDADGRITASSNALGHVTTFTYDAAGRRRAVTDALGNTTSYAYDAAGRQTSMTDARGNTTSFSYDAAGRLTRTVLADGSFTSSTYDSLGRRLSTTDAEGNITQYAYDGAGRLIAVTDALGGTTRYGYDQRGMQISQTDALGRTTRYEYDAMGRRSARILPQGQREEMTYNNLGLLTSHKDFNGRIITRSYESHTHNLLSVAAPSNHPSLSLAHAPARYDFTYDVLGRRHTATVTNKLGATLSSETFTYDIRSQLTGYTGPSGTIGYAYDRAGNLAGTKSGTTGGYDVSYDYDDLNRITMVYRGQEGTDPAATELAAYNYDANGNLNGSGYANGVQHAYTYNSVNHLTDLGISRSVGVSPTSLQGYSYSLNKNGHRTRISELSGRSIAHTFDKLHRLTREVITSSLITDHPALGTLAYAYDAVGNRNTRSSIGTIAQILPYQGVSFNANDRLSTGASYDANGNTLTGTASSSSPFTDIYSFDNRLIRRSQSNGMVVDITYNTDGHRLSKLVSNNGLTQRVHRYLTDANNPTGYAQVIEETDPLAPNGQQLKKNHLYGHDLIATESRSVGVSPTESIFYQYDGLGSVRSITNEDGHLKETYDYDAYGTLIALAKRNPDGDLESSPISNLQSPVTSEHLFCGEQWDADLGMYFLRARYLDTNTGRFHTQDTYEGRNGEPLTLHKYLYAHGNPVMNRDPSGNLTLSEQSLVSFMINIARPTNSVSTLATRFLLSQIQIAIQLAYIRRYYPAIISSIRAQKEKTSSQFKKSALEEAALDAQNTMINATLKATTVTLSIHAGGLINLGILGYNVYSLNADIVKKMKQISFLSGGKVVAIPDRASSIFNVLTFSASPELAIDAFGNIMALMEQGFDGARAATINDINTTIIKFELSKFGKLEYIRDQ